MRIREYAATIFIAIVIVMSVVLAQVYQQKRAATSRARVANTNQQITDLRAALERAATANRERSDAICSAVHATCPGAVPVP